MGTAENNQKKNLKIHSLLKSTVIFFPSYEKKAVIGFILFQYRKLHKVNCLLILSYRSHISYMFLGVVSYVENGGP